MRPILLCLHGWGGSKESFAEIREELKREDIEWLVPDLPGFGEESAPKTAWTIDDYAEWAEKYLVSRIAHARPVSILGHSHGGRIAIKMAVRGKVPIQHLYLCAAAGIRHPWHIKRFIGYFLAKVGKVLLSIPGMHLLQPIGKKLLYKLMRVHDYEKASPVMQQTMINVTKEDLKDILPQIREPTDLFWGADDQMTPVSDAFTMRERIKGSQLHIYQGVRHSVHRAKAADIASVIRERMQSEGLLENA